jgi:hypothetical protein
VQFEARGGPNYVECGISKGAILSFDFLPSSLDLDFTKPRFPFKATAFVSTSREKDSTPSIIPPTAITPQDIDDIWSHLLPSGQTAEASVDLMRKINTNKQEIDVVNNQLIVYDDDGLTPLITFNLFDRNGNPSGLEVFKREPV